MNYRCKYCLLNSTEKLINKLPDESFDKNEMVDKLLSIVAEFDDELIPELAARLYRSVKAYTGINDPWFDEKELSNKLALDYYYKLKKTIDESEDPFHLALRYSIAGNIMDVAAVPDFIDKPYYYMEKSVYQVLETEFYLNQSKVLQQKIHEAGNVLFLGDNSGEIVFDK
ncbi:MAG: hypothetical protein C0594_09550, partial [Marinilabiliales bacterium]